MPVRSAWRVLLCSLAATATVYPTVLTAANLILITRATTSRTCTPTTITQQALVLAYASVEEDCDAVLGLTLHTTHVA